MNKPIGAVNVLFPLLILGEGEGEVTRPNSRHKLRPHPRAFRKTYSLNFFLLFVRWALMQTYPKR